MTRLFSSVAVCVAALALSTAAHAVTISVAGGGGPPKPIGETGQLQVIIDIAPENHTFTNGGIALQVSNSQPGVIAFTSAEVDNRNIFGANIWSLTSQHATVDPDVIPDMFAASVSTQALNQFLPGNPIMDGGTEFLFATINYEVIGGGGTEVQVEVSSRPDPIFSGGVDVSSQLTFVPSEPILGVPEPTSLALIGLGLTALACGRRRV